MTNDDTTPVRRKPGRPSKFTDEDKATIAARYVAGDSTRMLADDYKVYPGSICHVLKLMDVPRRTRREAEFLRRRRAT